MDVLPEGLRGLPEAQIRQSLGLITQSLTAANQRTQALERELQEARRKPKNDPPPQPEKPKRPEGKSFADFLLEDPESALDEYFQKRGTPVIQQVQELSNRIGDAELNFVRTQVDDFAEHEAEVLELLEQSGSPRTREAVLGAYTMVIGQKAIQERHQRGRRELNSESPPPDSGTPPAKQYNKTALTEEIRVGLGLSEEEYYEKYSNSANGAVRVPR